LPFVQLALLPLVNRIEPIMFGLPFFHFWLVLWIVADTADARLAFIRFEKKTEDLSDARESDCASHYRYYHFNRCLYRLSRRKQINQSRTSVEEWSVGGRRFGGLLVWFFVGADLYTAYTFLRVDKHCFYRRKRCFFRDPLFCVGLLYRVLFLAEDFGKWRKYIN
jgi:hypothetical protein